MRLILMRHAKSDWSSGTTRDHDRPLNPRGTRAARAMGDWLRLHGYAPGQVLCSTATRTRDTLANLGLDAPVDYLPALYHAEPWDMLDALRGAAAPTVLMIGHNPGIGEFASEIVEAAPNHPRFAAYPTCATLVADFDGADWRGVQPGMARVVDFIVPRDLVD
ncbi:histidine phosphatase family protein [Lutimaribacter sp. EGI FJ00015]|uniref:Histidine phosphatase family protein n=1 Tax=Lutimaribacter degradans TaxID=2945989 RepID=A0ACC5ZZ75_9RHOB|nr:histidine phosphatase family protein [Lutimaribacter sp. EGI FJ00013]MCM2563223.1 histidine phosphatase family protein [Lutimaribacter sp. EGI FJ00013]MCO0614454.1 histidine phosphatase family protein [Lutimaribacter sp. EGI FJ00015]MCO0635945.1 histidine phosphatase family protein [Lutimaribacter sp. EGI FJ00014]